ncbi:hypothetical protein LG311_03060 [Sutcliffiella horikoshii]|uniref:hypothetical protein n=1 Tax=Sutcliffiella horikoshii TaxID=79883 RepID=UPI00384FD07D
MKKYALLFMMFFAGTYFFFVVLKIGETFTKGIHVFILSLIMVTIHWMWDSFNTPTKEKDSK